MRQHGTAAALVGLLALAWSVSLAPPADATIPVKVTINTSRSDLADTWSVSGGISDSGSFVDPVEFFAGQSSTFHAMRIFRGEAGTFTARADVVITPSQDPNIAFVVTGRWAILRGTGAYSTLRGQGSIMEKLVTSPCCSLVGTWPGLVHYD